MTLAEKASHGASNMSYVTSGGTVVAGGLSANEWIALGGLTLGLLTFLVNWYYRHKTYQLAVAARLDDIQKQSGGNNAS